MHFTPLVRGAFTHSWPVPGLCHDVTNWLCLSNWINQKWICSIAIGDDFGPVWERPPIFLNITPCVTIQKLKGSKEVVQNQNVWSLFENMCLFQNVARIVSWILKNSGTNISVVLSFMDNITTSFPLKLYQDIAILHPISSHYHSIVIAHRTWCDIQNAISFKII